MNRLPNALELANRGKEEGPMRPFVEVTEEAREVGFSCRVLITRGVWYRCCMWSEEDTKRQGYQDQDARISEVLFAAAMKMTAEAAEHSDLLIIGGFKYQIQSVRRGGSKEAGWVTLRMVPVIFKEGTCGLIVSFPDERF